MDLMIRTARGLLVLVLVAGVNAGCARRDETVVRRDSTYISDDDGFGPDRTVERRTTTTAVGGTPGTVDRVETTTTRVEDDDVDVVVRDDDEPRGVLSTTVHFIGEILALPFRLVGGLLRAIF